jgi:hypothetical protein
VPDHRGSHQEGDVTMRFVLKTNIRFNGRDYAGVEEMPEEVRQAYEQARATLPGANRPESPDSSATGLPPGVVSQKIIFNGQEYHSVNDMPATLRRLYADVMAAVDANKGGTPGGLSIAGHPAGSDPLSGGQSTPSAPLSLSTNVVMQAESTSWRLVIAGIVAALAAFTFFALGR